MTRYRWVAARKAEGFPITAAARVAEVSRQAFHDWQAAEAAGPNEAKLAETLLVEAIRAIHDEFDGTYGEPCITEGAGPAKLEGEPQADRAPHASPRDRRRAQAGQGAHHLVFPPQDPVAELMQSTTDERGHERGWQAAGELLPRSACRCVHDGGRPIAEEPRHL